MRRLSVQLSSEEIDRIRLVSPWLSKITSGAREELDKALSARWASIQDIRARVRMTSLGDGFVTGMAEHHDKYFVEIVRRGQNSIFVAQPLSVEQLRETDSFFESIEAGALEVLGQCQNLRVYSDMFGFFDFSSPATLRQYAEMFAGDEEWQGYRANFGDTDVRAEPRFRMEEWLCIFRDGAGLPLGMNRELEVGWMLADPRRFVILPINLWAFFDQMVYLLDSARVFDAYSSLDHLLMSYAYKGE